MVHGTRLHRLTVIIDTRIDQGWIGWQTGMNVGSHVSGSDAYALINRFSWLHSILYITFDFHNGFPNFNNEQQR